MRDYEHECKSIAVNLFLNVPDEVWEAYTTAADGATLNDIGEAAEFDFHCHQHEGEQCAVDSPTEAVTVLEEIDERHHETDKSQYEEDRQNEYGAIFPNLLETIQSMANCTLENLVRFHVCEIHEFILTHRNAETLDRERFDDLVNEYESA